MKSAPRPVPLPLLGLVAVAVVTCSEPTNPARTVGEFESQLEQLRVQAQIPGLAAAIVADGGIAWTLALGHADLENDTRVADTTAFHLASLTKPFASVILL